MKIELSPWYAMSKNQLIKLEDGRIFKRKDVDIECAPDKIGFKITPKITAKQLCGIEGEKEV